MSVTYLVLTSLTNCVTPPTKKKFFKSFLFLDGKSEIKTKTNCFVGVNTDLDRISTTASFKNGKSSMFCFDIFVDVASQSIDYLQYDCARRLSQC